MSKLPSVPRETPEALRQWLIEASKRIAANEDRVASLEASVEALTARVEALEAP